MKGIMELICDIITETKVTQTGEVDFRYYRKGEFLGKGGFANCFELYKTTSGKLLAGKIIEKESLQQKLQTIV